jgi:hypothetical protein
MKMVKTRMTKMQRMPRITRMKRTTRMTRRTRRTRTKRKITLQELIYLNFLLINSKIVVLNLTNPNGYRHPLK